MNFSIDHLKAGFRLRRALWPVKKWICLGSTRDISGNQLHNEHLRHLRDKDPELTATVLPFIIMRDGAGRITMGWHIGQVDLLAEDWEIKHGDDV